jgi:hypothetical protein
MALDIANPYKPSARGHALCRAAGPGFDAGQAAVFMTSRLRPRSHTARAQFADLVQGFLFANAVGALRFARTMFALFAIGVGVGGHAPPLLARVALVGILHSCASVTVHVSSKFVGSRRGRKGQCMH